MSFARRNTGTRVRREESYNSERTSTRECTDWLADRLGAMSAKEIADKAGLSIAGAESLKQGRSGASMKTITELCRNDALFRAEYFLYCGGHLECDPEFVAGLNHVLTNAARRLHNGS